TPHFPTSPFSGAFLQARPDSRNLHIRISISRHFLIFASFSILLSHAQWTSMQHPYFYSLLGTDWVSIHLVSMSPGGTCRRNGDPIRGAEETNYDSMKAKKLQLVHRRRSNTILYVVWNAEET
ncbi:hypothetical protein BDR03DRAFT_972233, partial [Suillus americanus]